MYVACFDLEGVFVPEVWINVAKMTGIDELKLTTRDITDYDVLMQKRLSILKEHDLKLKDIQDVIEDIQPLDGAKEFIDYLKTKTQVFIVSDTFTEFAAPLMEKLDWPTIFCNSLEINENDEVTGYKIRQKDQKRKVVQALKSLNYDVVASGDSYNDISMLKEADQGILFRPPRNVIDDYPDFPVFHEYEDLMKKISDTIQFKK